MVYHNSKSSNHRYLIKIIIYSSSASTAVAAAWLPAFNTFLCEKRKK